MRKLPMRLVSYHQSERGYTLVALIGLMTIMALFALAAAPSLHQQAQREREKDAIFRGEQVADAIRLYYKYRASQNARGIPGLPTSMDQLLEGVQRGTKKLQILRISAAKDPLSTDGDWRLVGPNTQQLIDFERSVIIYSGNNLPVTTDPDLKGQQDAFAPPLGGVINFGSTQTSSGGDDSFASSSGPFVGVASRSRRNSIINYYGIGRHDQWIFTPLFR
ncbi:MAG: type II secretion system protein [Pyrinomonadaceae bacterium]